MSAAFFLQVQTSEELYELSWGGRTCFPFATQCINMITVVWPYTVQHRPWRDGQNGEQATLAFPLLQEGTVLLRCCTLWHHDGPRAASPVNPLWHQGGRWRIWSIRGSVPLHSQLPQRRFRDLCACTFVSGAVGRVFLAVTKKLGEVTVQWQGAVVRTYGVLCLFWGERTCFRFATVVVCKISAISAYSVFLGLTGMINGVPFPGCSSSGFCKKVAVVVLADNALESLIRGSLAREQYEFCTFWTFLCALLFGVLFISLRVTVFVVCSSLFVLVVAVHVCHRMYKRQWTQERLRKSSAPGGAVEKLWCW